MNKNEWRVLPFTFWNLIAEHEFHTGVCISSFARLLGAYLHTHKDNDRLGIFEVSVGDLAQATGLPYATLKTALNELQSIPYKDTFLVVWDAGLVYTPMILDATITNNLDQRRYLKNRVKSALRFENHRTEYESQLNIAFQAWAVDAQEYIHEVASDKEFSKVQQQQTAPETTTNNVHGQHNTEPKTENTVIDMEQALKEIQGETATQPQKIHGDSPPIHGDFIQNPRDSLEIHGDFSKITETLHEKPPNHRDFAILEHTSRSFIPNSP